MAKRISKRDTIIHRTAYGGGAVLMGLPFMVIGGYFAVVGFDFLPLPSKANAPLWVIGCVGLAFAVVGLLVFVVGLRGLANRRRAKGLRGRLDQPWFRDYDWEPRGITDRAFGRPLQSLFFALFMTVFLAPFNWWAFVSPDGNFMIKAIVGIFDLALVLVVGSFFYRLGQFLKYGFSHLRFVRFPFFPGEELAVIFRTNRFEKLTFTLRFVEERLETRGAGSNRSTHHVIDEHYKEQRTLEPRPGDSEVDVAFDLPDNPEWVNAMSGKPVRYWELLVEAETPGIDFKTSFPVPVYAHAEEAAACTP